VLITDLAKLSNRPNDRASNQVEDQAQDQEKNRHLDQQVDQPVAQHVDQTIARLQGVEYVQAPPIKTTKDYSDLLLTGLREYVAGTYVLIIQWDSFILHPELWTNDFLQYDYIGAVWPHHPDTPVGNGGFSLRSVKLLEALESPAITKRHPEDFCICDDNKATLENQFGIRFAPTNIAERFAVERTDWHPAFGFHGFFNFGKALKLHELTEFLQLLPDAYLGGVDTYDLMQYLIEHQNKALAESIWQRVTFKWKRRRQYLKMLKQFRLSK